MRLLSLAACVMLVFITYSLEAATYYVSASGKDANTGTSKSQAWASIDKVNETVFVPGDSVLFEGGSTFSGSIYFDSKVRGTASKPIFLGSHGTGRAKISSGSNTGIYVYNSAGFKIENIEFMGSGRTSSESNGIKFYMDLPNNTRLDYIAIDRIEVSGYRYTGISIGSWNGASGFHNVSITNSSVHDNGDGGIGTYGEITPAHRNVYVGNIKVYNNAGLPEKTDSHSGNGIVLGDVDGAIIEHCEAYNNGWLNAWSSGGPVGIWGYRCNNLIIQYNESHHNKTGTTKDGGGFDIDGGCTNSIMQYNYSHDNEGAGYLVAQYVGAPAMKGVIVRYNISENDGRKNGYGAIHLWSSGASGGIQDLEVYNNTIYLTPATSGSPKALCVQSGGAVSAQIRNNIFQVTNSLELVNAAVTAGVKFEGNDYWATGSSAKYKWGSTTYSTLEAWRTATGQEKLNGIASGYSLDPELKQPGQGITLSDTRLLHTLQGYEQKETSPLLGKGIDLAATLNKNTGTTDFYGNSIVQRSTYAIGAHHLTTNSKVCLNSGTVLLDFGTTAGGTYSGPGVTEGKYFNPLSTGTGNKALTYTFTDKNNLQQLTHHTITVIDDSSCPSKSITIVAPTTCSATGSILREHWGNVSGSSVSDIPLSTKPTSTSQLSLFEAPTNLGSSYGARVRGYICPPQTGDYTFFIAGDDNAELWLSTDESQANRKKIASVTGWTYSREWNKYASQKSAAVRLEAGKKYYIEALHKQGWGSGNLAVAWKMPDGKTEAPIAGGMLSPYSSSIANESPVASAGTDKTITLPANSVSLSGSGIDSDGTISSYSWSKVSGPTVTLSGATSANLTVSNLLEGTYVFRLVVTDNGGASVSDDATVTVHPALTTSCSATGSILREHWGDVSGSSVSDIPLSTKPSSTSQLSLFEAPTNLGSSYGARVRGYICPPQTGDYTFFIAGDDNAELWLSTDESQANRKKIASVTGWTYSREWNKYASQKSAAVRLEAGKKYYIEALHKQGWGSGNLAVAWKMPDGTMEAPVAGSKLSPYLATSTGSGLVSASNLQEEEPQLNEAQLKAYPNPFTTDATVQFTLTASEEVSLDLYDIQGRLVRRLYQGTAEANATRSFELTAEGLTRGVYIIRLVTGSKVLTQKIVLEK
ncbi:T9SS C-terminal target domain-containing protein [Pontibacter diazotrophicus]|uniref:T9SS C-terminal target domain-containing protein n=1 Tax=Pontibacter diazotrophicus TaxID=1400979 RepID=A0A3D8LH96_9BACT|nr:PA14 domain-containing protein [Pontibacter diazotrophicus]RDV16716.1 T9SS C-terminal target domain-containing protein [Pontibacter diazotrophicus]